MRDEAAAMPCASGPLRRTTPIPPRPGGVAMATMVSLVENITTTLRRATQGPGLLHGTRAYFRDEMKTVLEKASPTLSVVAPGTSATARCTRRRS